MKQNPAMTVIYAIIIVILLAVGYFTSNKSNDEIKTWNFKGVVEEVTIKDPKNNPVIKVNGKDYDLSNVQLNTNIGIYKGDTLIKNKGDLVIKMIKPNTKDTIYCNKP